MKTLVCALLALTALYCIATLAIFWWLVVCDRKRD